MSIPINSIEFHVVELGLFCAGFNLERRNQVDCLDFRFSLCLPPNRAFNKLWDDFSMPFSSSSSIPSEMDWIERPSIALPYLSVVDSSPLIYLAAFELVDPDCSMRVLSTVDCILILETRPKLKFENVESRKPNGMWIYLTFHLRISKERIKSVSCTCSKESIGWIWTREKRISTRLKDEKVIAIHLDTLDFVAALCLILCDTYAEHWSL